jgi:hypothetical protein
MLPWQKAKHWWDNHSTQDFWEVVGEHLSAGYVWSSPECFMLARAVRWNAEENHFEQGQSNCWHVTLAASTGHANACGEFMRVFPHPQPWVSWFRGSKDKRVRVYDWDKLTKATRRK